MKEKNHYPVLNLYRTYKTLPIPQLHNYFILMLMHKFNYNRNLLPALFLLYFTENFQIHGHNTRQINLLHVDREKTTTGLRSIKFKVARPRKIFFTDFVSLHNSKTKRVHRI